MSSFVNWKGSSSLFFSPRVAIMRFKHCPIWIIGNACTCSTYLILLVALVYPCFIACLIGKVLFCRSVVCGVSWPQGRFLIFLVNSSSAPRIGSLCSICWPPSCGFPCAGPSLNHMHIMRGGGPLQRCVNLFYCSILFTVRLVSTL